MDRKKFFGLFGTGAVGAAAIPGMIDSFSCKSGLNNSGAYNIKKKVLMKVGFQSGGTTRENLEFKAR